MSDDITKRFPTDDRLDSLISVVHQIAADVKDVKARLTSLEEQAEQRAIDTKPIWERALAEILEVKEGLYDVGRKLNVLSHDIVQVRADQQHLERRMDKLESKPM